MVYNPVYMRMSTEISFSAPEKNREEKLSEKLYKVMM